MTKILLVEDDKSLREIYGVRLLAEGYDIVSAGDGEEALAMAIKDRPGLIISDVMMPKISGFDMLDILRSTTETKDIKVIMMTALSSEEQRQRGVALGADRYLVKSQVGIEDVVRTVHEVLGDAPIVGQAPLVSRTAPTPAPQRVTPPVVTPVVVAPMPTASMSSNVRPVPVSEPTINPIAPVSPSVRPVQQMVVPAPAAPLTAQPAPSDTLPQPIAPFSTPRINGSGTLASRVIQPPVSSNSTTPDFSHLMNQELNSANAVPVTPSVPAPAPSQQTIYVAQEAPQPPVAEQQPPAPTSYEQPPMNFEETPRPLGPPQTPPPTSPTQNSGA